LLCVRRNVPVVQIHSLGFSSYSVSVVLKCIRDQARSNTFFTGEGVATLQRTNDVSGVILFQYDTKADNHRDRGTSSHVRPSIYAPVRDILSPTKPISFIFSFVKLFVGLCKGAYE